MPICAIPVTCEKGCVISRTHCEAAIDIDAADRLKLWVAKAHKALGFFYRHRGQWAEADGSYQQAFNAISRTLSTKSDPNDREEMASILGSNWAYVKGLCSATTAKE